jgi:dTDP-L-rhamnose 4-epimerase
MADLTKARVVLGYQPQWSFSAGLRNFLLWAMENELPQNRYEQSLAEMKQRGLLSD